MAMIVDTVIKLITDILTKNFTSSKLVDRNTKLSKHLHADDGIGGASSKKVFEGLIDYNFVKSGYLQPSWPTSDWLDMTVGELADFLAKQAKPKSLT